jgi:hypothetical protein
MDGRESEDPLGDDGRERDGDDRGDREGETGRRAGERRRAREP